MKKLAPPFLLLCLLIAVSELLVRSGYIPAYLVPAPSQILICFVESYTELLPAFISTGFSALLGFTISVCLGSFIATGLSISPLAKKVLYPYTIFFQTVPIIAIAPLLVIWFGYDRSSVIASSVIVSIFPIISATLTGLQSTDNQWIDLFKIHNASSKDIFLKLKVPFAIPYFLNGLNTAGGLAIIGAIVGEFISGNGLGSVIDVARTQYRVDKVFASVLLAACLGLFSFSMIRLLSHLLLRHWHPSEKNK